MRQRPTPCVSQADLTLAEARSGASRIRMSRLAHPVFLGEETQAAPSPAVAPSPLASVSRHQAPEPAYVQRETWRLWPRGGLKKVPMPLAPSPAATVRRMTDRVIPAPSPEQAIAPSPFSDEAWKPKNLCFPPALCSVPLFRLVEVVLRPSLAVSTTVATTPLPVSAAPVTSLPEHRPGTQKLSKGCIVLAQGRGPCGPCSRGSLPLQPDWKASGHQHRREPRKVLLDTL